MGAKSGRPIVYTRSRSRSPDTRTMAWARSSLSLSLFLSASLFSFSSAHSFSPLRLVSLFVGASSLFLFIFADALFKSRAHFFPESIPINPRSDFCSTHQSAVPYVRLIERNTLLPRRMRRERAVGRHLNKRTVTPALYRQLAI